MRVGNRAWPTTIAVALVTALVVASSSSASFPGANGKIALVRSDQDRKSVV